MVVETGILSRDFSFLNYNIIVNLKKHPFNCIIINHIDMILSRKCHFSLTCSTTLLWLAISLSFLFGAIPTVCVFLLVGFCCLNYEEWGVLIKTWQFSPHRRGGGDGGSSYLIQYQPAVIIRNIQTRPHTTYDTIWQ